MLIRVMSTRKVLQKALLQKFSLMAMNTCVPNTLNKMEHTPWIQP